MTHFSSFAGWGAAAIGLLLSPILLIFGVPFLVGIGLDVIERWGEAPIAVALCAPVFLVFVRRLPWSRIAAFCHSRLHPAHGAKLHYVP